MSKERPAAILKHFANGYPSAQAKEVAATFYSLADELDTTLPDSAEKSAGLRKLLEAKDCFTRAALPQETGD